MTNETGLSPEYATQIGTGKPLFYLEPRGKFIRIILECEEDSLPPLRDVTAFIYYFNSLYEVIRLATDPQYDQFKFTSEVKDWENRPLVKDALLLVEEIHHASPLRLRLILTQTFAGITAAAALVVAVNQTISLVQDHKLKEQQKEINSLQIQKLRNDATTAPDKDPNFLHLLNSEGLKSHFEKTKTDVYIREVTKKIEKSTIRIRKIEVETGTQPRLRSPKDK